jgi:acyl-CoA synthetase (AMP-forming)/AMP-acid ligase II
LGEHHDINTPILTLLSAAQMDAFYEAGYWRDETIYSLIGQHAARAPDKAAIRERLRLITYRSLVDAADRLAAELHRRGTQRGERVAVWLPSRIETAVVLLACSRNGYVCSPSLHRDHTPAEISDLLEQMRAVALIAEAGYGAGADRHDIFEAASKLESMRLVVRLEPRIVENSAEPTFADLPAGSSNAEVRTDPNTIVYLAFTSGTTGRPKGVMHSDNTLLAPTRALAADWSLDQHMVVYSLSPLSHNLGFGAMIMALTGGGELVVHDLERGASVAERFVETSATFAFGVPTHAIDLLAELQQERTRSLPSLKGFRISGAPIPPFVARGLLEHGIVPQSGYGMTEAGSHNYTLPDDDPALIVETSGKACAGHEVRIFSRDASDEELLPGQIGQIGVRGACLMLGYFGDQASTEAAFNSRGWFMTGDLGWIDDAGYLRVTGRSKDVIIRGGHNIFPAKIESLVTRHVGIDRAVVVPVADSRLGEKVCLVVTERPGDTVDAGQILAHLDAIGLSKFDMPEYFLRLDDLPLLPSGKIAKRELVAWIEDGRVQPTPVRFEPQT